ncbi:MAG: PDZ domain-containing protein [Thermodesulfobacteriota bacterium]
MVAIAPIGAKVPVKIFRKKAVIETQVVVEEMAAAVVPLEQLLGKSRLDGARISELTDDIRQKLRLPAETSGVVVTEVEPGSPAFRAGARPGDVILEVNRNPVANLGQFKEVLDAALRSKSGLLLLINRRGAMLYLALG